MNNFISWLEKNFVPIAGRIGSQRHLVAIRDGFVSVMPLILIGSLAVLINNFPNDWFQNTMLDIFGEKWKSIGGSIWTGSFAILAILVTFTISYYLAKSYNKDGVSTALLAVGSYIIIAPATPTDWGIQFAWLGAQGLFVAILVAIVVTELFRFFTDKNLVIKMPDGVPPAVARSFAALIPAFLVFIIVALVQLLVSNAGTSIHQWIFDTLQSPLQDVSDTLGSALLFAFLIHLFWFFGLHGANILGPIMDSIYLPSLEENIKFFDAGKSAFDAPNIVTKPFFDVFVHMGGAGATLALLVAIFLVAKSATYRSVGKYSTPAGLFNINEPVLFGIPVVLNAYLFIPFLLVPIVLTFTSYAAIAWLGIVPKTVVLVPWAMPPIISGYLVTGGSIMGVLLQIVNFFIAVCIYLPFIKVADRQARSN